MTPRRCPIHGTVVCPLAEGAPFHDLCRECQGAIKRIREGKPKYPGDVELEEQLLARAFKGVRKSLRHVHTYG